MTAAGPDAPAVVARGLSMSGRWGGLFGPLDLDIGTNGVTVLVGPTGLAATALLLTLSGRMRPTAGTLTVLGHTSRSWIRRYSSPAALDDLDGLDEFTTVSDLVTERIRWSSAWYRVVLPARGREVDAMCRPVFGPLSSPPASAFVGRLGETDQVLLRIALANIRRPPLLVVGSIDQIGSRRCQGLVLSRLADLAKTQTVITAAADDVSTEFIRSQVHVDTAAVVDLCAQHADGE